MRILILGWQAPATASMPGSPRLFSLCRELSRDSQLDLLLMPQEPDRMMRFRNEPEVHSVFRGIEELPAPPDASWIRRQFHRAHREPDFSTRQLAPQYHEAICKRIRSRCADVDLLLADGISATQYVRDVPVPAVADVHDAISLLLRRSAERAETLGEKTRLWLESRSVARLERALSQQFRLVITNSDVDRDEIRRLDPSCNVMTIPNGVDTQYFSPGNVTTSRNRLVFTGVMGYGPNDDAAQFFISDVLPLIRKEEPECEFWAVGHEPSASLMALDRRDGVRVTGSVPDVRPFVREARAYICPLRYGTGMKNKILAAMSMRRPVVATSISLDGIGAVPDEHVLVADSPKQLAEQCLRLIRDDELVLRLCDSAQEWVEKNFSWAERAAQLWVELSRQDH